MKTWMLGLVIFTQPVFAQNSMELSFEETIKVKKIETRALKPTQLKEMYLRMLRSQENIYRRPAIIK